MKRKNLEEKVGFLEKVRATIRNHRIALAVTALALGSVEAGCGPIRYISTERRPAPEGTTQHSAGRELEYSIDCSPQEKQCLEGHYYLCVRVIGNCNCYDATETYYKKVCAGVGEDRSCSDERRERDVRLCRVENVALTPSNVEQLTGEEIPEYHLDEALRCSPRWNSSLGYKSGTLWVNIPERDPLCRATKPSE